MITLVWLVSWFCVTEVCGCTSPPALFWVSIFILEHFNLNRDGLLVHCGIFTSTVCLFCHGISLCVYIYITQVWVCGCQFKSSGKLRMGKVNVWRSENTQLLRGSFSAPPAEDCGCTGQLSVWMWGWKKTQSFDFFWKIDFFSLAEVTVLLFSSPNLTFIYN